MSDHLEHMRHVALERHDFTSTPDELLWEIIKDRTAAISFVRYSNFIDCVLSDGDDEDEVQERERPRTQVPAVPAVKSAAKRVTQQSASDEEVSSSNQLASWDSTTRRTKKRMAAFGPFNGDAYDLLKAATEYYVFAEVGRLEEVIAGKTGNTNVLTEDRLAEFRKAYLVELREESVSKGHTLPYLDIIRRKLSELPVKRGVQLGCLPESYGLLRSRLTSPILLELIWNYWIEQGLLVQTMNLVSLRFQNVRRGPGVDPLANLEIDPLRPLSNLLWGYLQDEINRLSVNRRSYEYAHGLGLQLVGRAVPEMHPADVRSQFLPAFHDLLRLAWLFFREDDDKTVAADAFPMLNALRELHFVISEGAHNQFGDLPMRARIEMLMQQWILGRPEMRDFLRGRTMVPYPESWMDRVDAMKALQGWNDASVINYADLAAYGEQIILSVRYGNWSTTADPNQAANWARAWRPAIQRYTHALRIVSAIDLSVGDVAEVRVGSERVAQGMVAGRIPAPGGRFVQPSSPAARLAGPRPSGDQILRAALPPGRAVADDPKRPR